MNSSEKGLMNTTDEKQLWHEKAEANTEISLGYNAETMKLLNKTGFFFSNWFCILYTFL